MTRPTSIGAAVAAAAHDLETAGGRSYLTSDGQRFVRYAVPHYAAEGYAHEGGGWTLVLRHYGTAILHVQRSSDGGLDSAIGPGWWGSATDCSAIAKAHRALGMRRSIKRGRLIEW